jgi:hypothetical protein
MKLIRRSKLCRDSQVAYVTESEPLKLLSVLLFVSLVMVAKTASADQTDDFVMATEVGKVIGGATSCGYTLDPKKVAALAAGKIADLEITARMNFQNAQDSEADQIASMTEIEHTS